VIGWLAGAATGCVMPGILFLMMLWARHLHPEDEPPDSLRELAGLFLVFGAPGLGAAAVGAALGLRRWRAAAVCLPAAVALALACWAHGGGPSLKEMVLVLPWAAANACLAALGAGKVAGDRRAR
jgi:hypothetical protein